MMEQLPKPARRAAAVGLLVLFLCLLALLTVVPFATYIASLRDQIEAERFALGRFAQVASREGEVADLDRAGRASLSSGAYLKGESEALIAAGLQSVLAEIGAANRVRFTSTRALPMRDRGEGQFIGVRVQFSAEIEQLRAFLHRIETNRPFLLIEGLHVQPISPYSQRDPEQAGILDVRLDVFGATPGEKG